MPLNSVFNYFHQKLHLKSLRGLICLCIYLVRQFWRWINEISKVCYEETQINCTKYVISEGSCLKNFVHFQEKHPREISFLNKVAGYLTLTGDVLLGNLCILRTVFTKSTCKWWLLQLVITGKCFDQNTFFKKYLIQFV